jgi:beta-glucosidase
MAPALATMTALALAGAPQAWAQGRCGAHPWCHTALSPDQRAALLLAAMTPDERNSMLTGGPVSRLDVPGLRFTDGGVGAGGLGSGASGATAMPAGIALAANFDPAMARRYGAVVGAEVKHRGFDGDFGPTVNIMRTPVGGRTFEAYGEDPFLAARTAVSWIDGLQAQGPMADVKHYAANNQEGQGGASPFNGASGGRFFIDANVDQRTLHEIYFPAFEAAVTEGHSATVMCSYNRLNGVYACGNDWLLTDVLRREWGFDGFVASDAGAAHETAQDLKAGLNYDILNTSYSAPEVNAALGTGMVTQATIDARVRETLRTLFAYGFFDHPAWPADASQDDRAGDNAVAIQAEAGGATLLRNDGTLPLDPRRVHSIAVIGPAATHYFKGGGSSQVTPYFTTSGLQGVQARAAAAGIKVVYDDGSNQTQAASTAKAADVAVVFAGDTQAEGTDKLCLSLAPECSGGAQSTPPDPTSTQSSFGDQDGLIAQVAAANPRTVVVLETGGPVLTPWRDRLAGLLEAWYPGQDGGTAIAHVLFGDADPGGRLPATFPQQESDLPTAGDPQKYPGVANEETYKEGVAVGYRWYDGRGITPAFPFGFGLSYATFRFTGLAVDPSGTGARVTVTVTNTGSRAGTAVPEVYLGLPSSAAVPQPPRQLKGFAKVALAPGQSARVSVGLVERAFAYWDVSSRSWRVAPGCYGVMVGSSSRDLPLHGVIARGGARCAGAPGRVTSPAGARCTARRTVRIHLPRRLERAGIRRLVVYVDGRRQPAVRRGRRTLRLSVRATGSSVARVRVVVRTRRRSTVFRRTYRLCPAVPPRPRRRR